MAQQARRVFLQLFLTFSASKGCWLTGPLASEELEAVEAAAFADRSTSSAPCWPPWCSSPWFSCSLPPPCCQGSAPPHHGVSSAVLYKARRIATLKSTTSLECQASSLKRAEDSQENHRRSAVFSPFF
eukprot:4729403-Lingulodinium_polyedra.AAC.1